MQSEETYTRDQPVWLHLTKRPPLPGLFVMYRKSKVVVDILLTDGSKWRKMASINALRPRETSTSK